MAERVTLSTSLPKKQMINIVPKPREESPSIAVANRTGRVDGASLVQVVRHLLKLNVCKVMGPPYTRVRMPTYLFTKYHSGIKSGRFTACRT
jgi:hypothetical protein